MATNHIVIAALSACLAAAPALAQNANPLAGDTTRALAEAKLARARGEFQKADGILKNALQWAKGADRTQLLAASDAVDGDLGKTTATMQNPGKPDPVKRLIATLNQGTRRQPKVTSALDELESLGALIVPTLLEALPNLGPFGLRNALNLLRDIDDPRIRPALEALCEKPNDAVVHAITKELADMRREVALPLALRFSNAGWPAATRFKALCVLVRYAPTKAKPLAMELARDFSLHSDLLELAGTAKEDLGKTIWRELAKNGQEHHRAASNGQLLLVAEGLTEAAAIATLEAMPESYRFIIARELAKRHREWVHVGLIAMKTTSGSRQGCGEEWFAKMEWWRHPNESMAMLIATPDEQFNYTNVRTPLHAIISSGWELPTELEREFANKAPIVGWEWFLRSLTIKGESRAIATWRSVSPDQRRALVDTATDLKMPWHELVLAHMESAPDVDSISFEGALRRSWRGMSQEQSKRLIAVIAAWQKQHPASQQKLSPMRNRPGARPGRSNQPNWTTSLLNGYTASNGIPSEALLPLIRDDFRSAFSAMAMMDPQRALQLASGWSADKIALHRTSVVELLKEHADARHIELAVKLAHAQVGPRHTGNLVTGIKNYLLAHGKGDVRVIALARRPGLDNKTLVGIALRSADGASVDDVQELLDLLPVLEAQTAYAVMRSLQPQWQKKHTPKILKLLDSMLAGENNAAERDKAESLDRANPDIVAESMLRVASRLGAEGVTERAQRILDAKDTTHRLQREAARVRIQHSGSDRSAVIASLLEHPSSTVVSAALVQPDIGTDANLRRLALAACLQHGEKLSDIDQLLANLSPVDRIAFAKAIVTNSKFASVSRDASLTALGVLGDKKDPSLVAAIATGNSHGDAVVREMVAIQLGRTFAKEAVPFLIDMLRDDSSSVRGAAETNLEQISNYLEAREKWQGRIK